MARSVVDGLSWDGCFVDGGCCLGSGCCCCDCCCGCWDGCDDELFDDIFSLLYTLPKVGNAPIENEREKKETKIRFKANPLQQSNMSTNILNNFWKKKLTFWFLIAKWDSGFLYTLFSIIIFADNQHILSFFVGKQVESFFFCNFLFRFYMNCRNVGESSVFPVFLS